MAEWKNCLRNDDERPLYQSKRNGGLENAGPSNNYRADIFACGIIVFDTRHRDFPGFQEKAGKSQRNHNGYRSRNYQGEKPLKLLDDGYISSCL